MNKKIPPTAPPASFQTCSFLDLHGKFVPSDICWEKGRWVSFQLGKDKSGAEGSYLVPSLPIDFHCHGLGGHDFSDTDFFDLDALNELLAREGIYCVPTLFLPKSRLVAFIDFVKAFGTGKKRGAFKYIAGLALEGPLLASLGGTPETGHWMPNEVEWKMLAECGSHGLKYMVVSPDAIGYENGFRGPYWDSQMPMEEIIRLLLNSGIHPALGHFQKSDPNTTARLVQKVIEISIEEGNQPFSGAILTDHLFNDTPLLFHHAWRTPEEQRRREGELLAAHLSEWTLDNLDRLAGPVPSVLMRAASEGLVTICLNFDGDHVDLDICRKVIDLVGPRAIVAMTDRADADTLGGQSVHRVPYNTLYYQDQGVVAAGSSSIDRQIANLRRMGVSESGIWEMIGFNSGRILQLLPPAVNSAPAVATYVDPDGYRYPILTPALSDNTLAFSSE